MAEPKTLFGARIGDRVRLRDGHPWAGYTGRVVAFDTCAGRPALLVAFDGPEQRGGLLYRNDIEVIDG